MKISDTEAKKLAQELNVDLRKTPLSEWKYGIHVEHEHSDIVCEGNGNLKFAKIARAHIKEHPRYYHYLAIMEKMLKAKKN